MSAAGEGPDDLRLGHADLAITSAHPRGIDHTAVIQAVHERPAPMIPTGQRVLPPGQTIL